MTLCRKCGKEPAVIYRGFVYKGRKCQAAFYTAWYARNRERTKARNRARYAAKRVEICATARDRYRTDPEYRAHKRALNQATIARHPDRARKRSAAYYRRTRGKRIAYVLAWRSKNVDKATEYNRRHRARRRNAPIVDLTLAQWEAIKAHWHHRCAYCGRKRVLTQDHVEPTSRGGSHTAANIVPACGPCNASKGDRLLLEWVLIAA